VTCDINAVGPKGRLPIGLLLIAVGLVMMLDQAGILRMGGLFRWWPLILIGAGIVKLRQPIEDGQRANGTALVVVGGIFLFFTALTWGKAWPLIFIMVGGFLLWSAFERPRPAGAAESPLLSELAIMGAVKRSVRSTDFRGGYITAVMGGVELDLRKSTIATSPAFVDVATVWGAIDLKVPADWIVEGRVVPFMGGFENKTQLIVDRHDAPRLVLRGSAVMGGVTISN
jgi:hypothetical protein